MQATISARERWQIDQPIYEEIGLDVRCTLASMLKSRGISAKVTHRVKEIDSLIKKIARKRASYEAIHDKVGVRIVVYFKEQLGIVDSLICQSFGAEVTKKEDMSEKLGEAIFGYQTIHYDICKLRNGTEYYCEIQLRTICQDNWSELSHAISYKTEINIPLHIRREINALSAVFELADNQFQLIQKLIDDLPDTSPIRVLNFLEVFFYSKIGDIYDRDLSGYFLKGINTLYDDSPIRTIQIFLDENEEKITTVVGEYRDNFFFSQPEIVLIMERLQNNKYSLIDYWNTLYPMDELEIIANAWGTSIE